MSASRWPARLDLAQSASGLLLALFMWVHMLFVSTILLGKDAMWTVARAFEGYFFFGKSYPELVAAIIVAVMLLIVLHAALALRKIPASYAQFKAFREHARAMHHGDTSLWLWQVATGLALLFIAFIHLYALLAHPGRIGPFESADRVWSDRLWPVYVVLLLSVEIHASIGLYRLCMKWGWPSGTEPAAMRRRLKTAKWVVTVMLLTLGFAALAAYMRIGIEHESRYGEPYEPAALGESGTDAR